MLNLQHPMCTSSKLSLTLTTLCLAIATTAATAALIPTEPQNKLHPSRHEYAYNDIYTHLIPDHHPYPSSFRYQIGLVYDVAIDMEDSLYQQELHITGIRLYEGNKLVQELATQSQGLYIPEIEDYNADGYIDLAIPLMSSSTEAFPYQYWLYNPEKQLFENTAQSFHTVTQP